MGLRSKLGNKLFKLAAEVSPDKKKGEKVSVTDTKSFIDLLERAVWTFVQAFVAVLVVTPVAGSKAAYAAAFAAGVSAVKTFVKNSL